MANLFLTGGSSSSSGPGTNSNLVYTYAAGPVATSTGQTLITGTRFYSELFIPFSITVTGIAILIGGGSSETDKLIVELHNSSGTLVATSSTAGTTIGANNVFQKIPLTIPYSASAGVYFISVQANGENDTIGVDNRTDNIYISGTVAGTFGVGANFTPGTSYGGTNISPIAATY